MILTNFKICKLTQVAEYNPPKTLVTENMLKAVIIDDEHAALETLKMKIEMYCNDVEILKVCSSAKEGLQAIHALKPNLVFLDIEMPWMNGFEMLDCLGDNIDFDVVFVTAYDQYAIKAFKVKAIDYILKPVDKEDLINCMERVVSVKNKFNREKLQDLLVEIEKPMANKRVLLHTKDAIEILSQSEIKFCQADSNYSIVHTLDEKKVMVTKSLNAIEKLLDPSLFVRVHRSYTVNINAISKFLTVDGSELMLSSGERIPVSRRRKEEILERLASK